jgi:hypothetical protein
MSNENGEHAAVFSRQIDPKLKYCLVLRHLRPHPKIRAEHHER